MPFVSITRLRIRKWFFLPAFFVQSQRISRQAARAGGNLAVRVLRDRRNAYWTATSWSSEASMKAFMHAEPHGPAMRSLLEWCDEAAVVHWEQPGAELPAWAEAYKRMQRDGRPSKVYHPSPAHTAFTIPAPKVAPRREVSLRS